MSDTNVNDLMRNLDDINQSLSRLTSSYRGATRDTGPYSDALRGSTRAVNDEAASRKKSIDQLKNDVSNFGASVTGAVKGLTGGNSSFTVLSSVMSTAITTMGGFAGGLAKLIPIFGEGISSLITTGSKAVAEASQIVIQQFETGFNAFKQASKVGAVNTFTELQESASKLNLRMEQLSAVYANNAEMLATIGGSAQAGTKMLGELGDSSKDLRDQFMRLGTSSDEFAGLQIGMMSNFRRAGFGLGDINKIQKEYMFNLDAISQLTGKSKEALQKEAAQRQKEFRYAARLQKLKEIDPAKFQKAQDQMALIAKYTTEQDQKAVQARFGTEGRVIGDEMAKDVYRLGPELEELAKALGDGTKTNTEMIRLVQEMNKKSLAKAMPYAATGSALAAGMMPTGDIIEKANLTPADIEKIKAEREKAAKDTAGTTAKLADAANSLQTASVNLQQSAVSLDIAVNGMKKIADKIRDITSVVRDQLGSGSTAPTTASPGQSIPGMSITGEVDQSGTGPSPTNPVTGGTTVTGPSNNTQLYGSSQGRGGKASLEQIEQMKNALRGVIPGATITSSGYREKGDNENSVHPLGRAIDFKTADLMKADMADITNKLRGVGFTGQILDERTNITGNRDWTGPHIHAAFADGGITSGPSLAGEAGPEAVVPLPDGRTIPVKIGNWDELIGVWTRIEDRLSQLVDLSEGQNSIQRKQLQFARN